MSSSPSATPSSSELRTLGPDASKEEILSEIDRAGAAIVRDLVDPPTVALLNRDFDPWVEAFRFRSSGNDILDEFAGRKTARLEGVLAKCPAASTPMIDARVLALCDHVLLRRSAGYVVSTGELIDIGPGETEQYLHRDDGSWPDALVEGETVVVSVMFALGDFTKETGATRIVPGSHLWPRDRDARDEEIVQAEMAAGSALLFRGDLLHGGGANVSSSKRRRGLAVSYCCGWLRPYENTFLTVPVEVARTLPTKMQDLLGYTLYPGEMRGGSSLGFYEYDDPRKALEEPSHPASR